MPTPPSFRRIALLGLTGVLCLFGLALLPPPATGQEAPTRRRPNVLFLLSDDQASSTMGCAGHPWLETPGMDRLAREGVRFTNAFVTTSLCSPSRASFLTGLYARSHGILDNKRSLRRDQVTFASLLTAAGWDSAYVGKWHMGGMGGPRPGFSYTASYQGQGKYERCRFQIGASFQEVEKRDGWVDDVATDLALEFLRKEREAPFLLAVGFKGPHRPCRPAARHAQEYAGETLPRPTNLAALPPYPLQHEHAALAAEAGVAPIAYEPREDWAAKLAEPRVLPPELLEESWPGEDMLDYHRVVKGVDENIARLLDELDTLGLAEDTIVVFAGDNGMSLGSHGMVSKLMAYDESMRIPLLVRYPRVVQEGVVSGELVLNVDVAPTLLALAGLPIPEAIQGKDLTPLLVGDDAEWRTAFLYEFFARQETWLPPQIGVRTRAGKLVVYPGRPSWKQFFDLDSDPHETRNLAGAPGRASELESHEALLRELEASLGARPASLR